MMLMSVFFGNCEVDDGGLIEHEIYKKKSNFRFQGMFFQQLN